MAFKSAKSAKAKGSSFERDIAKQLAEATGCDLTRRQPGSGAIQGFHGDVLHDPHGWAISIECKHHKVIAGYERLEKRRLLNDALIVDTPAGVYWWLEHDFWLDIMARAYGKGGAGAAWPSAATLTTGSALTTFNKWMKGCDVLVVKPNHGKPRWYVPHEFMGEVFNFAARAEFYIEELES